MKKADRLLYFCDLPKGGILEYAHEQADALAALGIEVKLLCRPEFPVRPDAGYRRVDLLNPSPASAKRRSVLIRSWKYLKDCKRNMSILADFIKREHFQHVLFSSYVEYFAPLWVGPLQRLASKGVVFGTIAHDPIRNFVVGPVWWHRKSIVAGYSFIHNVFVHDNTTPETGPNNAHLQFRIIPYGPHRFPAPVRSREEVRTTYNIPALAPLFLAFGHIRNDKNLDLIIRAMANRQDVYLLVAGDHLGVSHKPATFYQELARKERVDNRCRWEIRYVSGTDIGDLFEAADFCLMTYSRTFHSASSVMHTAAHYRKLSLASSGPGPLTTAIKAHRLGVWVEPDSVPAITEGLDTLITCPPKPDWDGYQSEHSWRRNAQIVSETMFGIC